MSVGENTIDFGTLNQDENATRTGLTESPETEDNNLTETQNTIEAAKNNLIEATNNLTKVKTNEVTNSSVNSINNINSSLKTLEELYGISDATKAKAYKVAEAKQKKTEELLKLASNKEGQLKGIDPAFILQSKIKTPTFDKLRTIERANTPNVFQNTVTQIEQQRDRTSREARQDFVWDLAKGGIGVLESFYGIANFAGKYNPLMLAGNLAKAISENRDFSEVQAETVTLDDLIGASKNFREIREYIENNKNTVQLKYRKQLLELRSAERELAKQERIRKRIEGGDTELTAIALDELSTLWETFKDYASDPMVAGSLAIESVPNLLGPVGVAKVAGSLTTKALTKQLNKQLGKKASAKKLHKFLNSPESIAKIKKARERGATWAIALSEAGNNSINARNEVLNKTHEELLKSSPEYRKLLKTKTPDEAKRILANKVEDVVFSLSGVLAGTASKVTGTDKFLGNLFSPKTEISKSIAKYIPTKAIGGAVREGIEEGLQGSGGQFAQNVGTKLYVDSEQELTEGLGQAAGTGIVAGGLSGGAFGSVGSITNKTNYDAIRARYKAEKEKFQRSENINVKTKENKAYQDAVKEGNITDVTDVVDKDLNVYKSYQAILQRNKIEGVTEEEKQENVGEATKIYNKAYTEFKEAQEAYFKDAKKAKKLSYSEKIANLPKFAATKKRFEQAFAKFKAIDSLKDQIDASIKVPEASSLNSKEDATRFMGSIENSSLFNIDPDNLDEAAKKEHIFTDSQRETIKNTAKAARFFQEASNVKGVHNHILNGGDDGRFGIKQHVRAVESTLKAGNESDLSLALIDFKSFAERHKEKYQVMQDIVDTSGNPSESQLRRLNRFVNNKGNALKYQRGFDSLTKVVKAESILLKDAYNKSLAFVKKKRKNGQFDSEAYKYDDSDYVAAIKVKETERVEDEQHAKNVGQQQSQKYVVYGSPQKTNIDNEINKYNGNEFVKEVSRHLKNVQTIDKNKDEAKYNKHLELIEQAERFLIHLMLLYPNYESNKLFNKIITKYIDLQKYVKESEINQTTIINDLTNKINNEIQPTINEQIKTAIEEENKDNIRKPKLGQEIFYLKETKDKTKVWEKRKVTAEVDSYFGYDPILDKVERVHVIQTTPVSGKYKGKVQTNVVNSKGFVLYDSGATRINKYIKDEDIKDYKKDDHTTHLIGIGIQTIPTNYSLKGTAFDNFNYNWGKKVTKKSLEEGSTIDVSKELINWSKSDESNWYLITDETLYVDMEEALKYLSEKEDLTDFNEVIDLYGDDNTKELKAYLKLIIAPLTDTDIAEDISLDTKGKEYHADLIKYKKGKQWSYIPNKNRKTYVFDVPKWTFLAKQKLAKTLQKENDNLTDKAAIRKANAIYKNKKPNEIKQELLKEFVERRTEYLKKNKKQTRYVKKEIEFLERVNIDSNLLVWAYKKEQLDSSLNPTTKSKLANKNYTLNLQTAVNKNIKNFLIDTQGITLQEHKFTEENTDNSEAVEKISKVKDLVDKALNLSTESPSSFLKNAINQWNQIKDANSVYIFGLRAVNKDNEYINYADGDLNWGIHLALNNDKAVDFFDYSANQWYSITLDSNNKQQWKEIDKPSPLIEHEQQAFLIKSKTTLTQLVKEGLLDIIRTTVESEELRVGSNLQGETLVVHEDPSIKENSVNNRWIFAFERKRGTVKRSVGSITKDIKDKISKAFINKDSEIYYESFSELSEEDKGNRIGLYSRIYANIINTKGIASIGFLKYNETTKKYDVTDAHLKRYKKLAIFANKPMYLYDLHTNSWYKLDLKNDTWIKEDTNNKESYIKDITSKFTFIGSSLAYDGGKVINDKHRKTINETISKVISNIYQQTTPEPKVTTKSNAPIILTTSDNRFKIEKGELTSFNPNEDSLDGRRVKELKKGSIVAIKSTVTSPYTVFVELLNDPKIEDKKVKISFKHVESFGKETPLKFTDNITRTEPKNKRKVKYKVKRKEGTVFTIIRKLGTGELKQAYYDEYGNILWLNKVEQEKTDKEPITIEYLQQLNNFVYLDQQQLNDFASVKDIKIGKKELADVFGINLTYGITTTKLEFNSESDQIIFYVKEDNNTYYYVLDDNNNKVFIHKRDLTSDTNFVELRNYTEFTEIKERHLSELIDKYKSNLKTYEKDIPDVKKAVQRYKVLPTKEQIKNFTKPTIILKPVNSLATQSIASETYKITNKETGVQLTHVIVKIPVSAKQGIQFKDSEYEKNKLAIDSAIERVYKEFVNPKEGNIPKSAKIILNANGYGSLLENKYKEGADIYSYLDEVLDKYFGFNNKISIVYDSTIDRLSIKYPNTFIYKDKEYKNVFHAFETYKTGKFSETYYESTKDTSVEDLPKNVENALTNKNKLEEILFDITKTSLLSKDINRSLERLFELDPKARILYLGKNNKPIEEDYALYPVVLKKLRKDEDLDKKYNVKIEEKKLSTTKSNLSAIDELNPFAINKFDFYWKKDTKLYFSLAHWYISNIYFGEFNKQAYDTLVDLYSKNITESTEVIKNKVEQYLNNTTSKKTQRKVEFYAKPLLGQFFYQKNNYKEDSRNRIAALLNTKNNNLVFSKAISNDKKFNEFFTNYYTKWLIEKRKTLNKDTQLKSHVYPTPNNKTPEVITWRFRNKDTGEFKEVKSKIYISKIEVTELASGEIAYDIRARTTNKDNETKTHDFLVDVEGNVIARYKITDEDRISYSQEKPYSTITGFYVVDDIDLIKDFEQKQTEIKEILKKYRNEKTKNTALYNHRNKDLAKASVATSFIGFGSPNSATNKYHKTFDKYGLANTGEYGENDIVFVSVNGKRTKGKRIVAFKETKIINKEGKQEFFYEPTKQYKIIEKAIAAKAQFVTDDIVNASSEYNKEGELFLLNYLTQKGYEFEVIKNEKDGTTYNKWKPSTSFDINYVDNSIESNENYNLAQDLLNKLTHVNEVPNPKEKDKFFQAINFIKEFFFPKNKSEFSASPNILQIEQNLFNRLGTDQEELSIIRDYVSTHLTEEEIVNSEDINIIKTLLSFYNETVNNFNKIFKEKNKDNENRYLFEDMMQYFQINESGLINSNLIGAITVAMFNWLATRSSGTVFNNEEIIRDILNLREGDKLDISTAYHYLGKAGINSQALIESIGLDIYKMLELTPNQEKIMVSTEGNLINSLGSMAVALLAEGDYISKNSVSVKVLQELSGKELNVNEEALSIFYRVKVEKDEFNNEVPIDSVVSIIEYNKLSNYFINKLFQVESYKKYPSTRINKRKQTTIKRTIQEVSPKQQEKLANQKSVAHRINKSMNDMASWLGINTWRDIEGYKYDIDNTVIFSLRETAKGINLAIDNQLEDFEEFKDILIQEHLATDPKYPKDIENIDFYYDYELYKNGRNGYLGGFNIQGNKFHRHLAYVASHKNTFKFGSETDTIFQLAVAQAFDISIDKQEIETSLNQLKESLEKPEVRNALEAIKKVRNAEYSSNITNEEKLREDIAKGIKELGLKAHSLQGLIEYARYEEAVDNPKENTFTTTIGIEVDGITNGVMIGNIQLSDIKTWYEFNKTFSKGGLSSNATALSFGKLQELNELDSYEDIVIEWNEYLSVIYSDLKKIKEGEQLKYTDETDAPFYVDYTEKQAAKLEEILNDLKEVFIKLINESQEIEGRNTVKYPLMTFMYGAGIKSIQNLVFGEFIDAKYDEIQEALNNYKETKDSEHFEIVKNIIKSFESITGEKDTIINDVWNEDTLLNFEFNKKQLAELKNRFNHIYGTTLFQALNNKFPTVVNNRKTVNDSVLVMAHSFNTIFTDKLQKFVERSSKKSEMFVLTQKDYDQILEETKELLPFVDSYFTFGSTEDLRTKSGILLGSFEDVRQYEEGHEIPLVNINKAGLKDSVGHLPELDIRYGFTNNSKEFTQVQSYRNRVGKDRIGSITSHSTVPMFGNVGVKPTVLLIQGIDGATALEQYRGPKETEIVNLHDAKITGVTDAIKSTKFQNEMFYTVNNEYSVSEAVRVALNSVNKGFHQYINNISDPFERQTVIDKFQRFFLSDVFSANIFKENDLLNISTETLFNSYNVLLENIHKRHRITMDNLNYINQYYLERGEYIANKSLDEIGQDLQDLSIDAAETLFSSINADKDLANEKNFPEGKKLPIEQTEEEKEKTLTYSKNFFNDKDIQKIRLGELLQFFTSNLIRGFSLEYIKDNVSKHYPSSQYSEEDINEMALYFKEKRKDDTSPFEPDNNINEDLKEALKEGNITNIINALLSINPIEYSKVGREALKGLKTKRNKKYIKVKLLNQTSEEHINSLMEFDDENVLLIKDNSFIEHGLSSYESLIYHLAISYIATLGNNSTKYKEIQKLFTIPNNKLTSEDIKQIKTLLNKVDPRIKDLLNQDFTEIQANAYGRSISSNEYIDENDIDFGSQGIRPDLEHFNADFEQKITKKNVLEVFKELGLMSFVKEDSTHANYLEKLLKNVVSKVMKPVNLHLKNDPDTETIGAIRGRDIYILNQLGNIQRRTMPVLLQGLRMSTQEVFAHELIHHIGAYAIDANSKAKQAIEALYWEVKKALDKHEEPWRVFLNDPTAVDDQSDLFIAERDAAIARYKYLFEPKTNDSKTGKSNYLQEFFAYGLTNKNFIKYLSTIKANTKKEKIFKGSLNDIFVKIFNWIGNLITNDFFKISDYKELKANKKLYELSKHLLLTEKENKNLLVDASDRAFSFVSDKLNKVTRKAGKTIQKTFVTSKMRNSDNLLTNVYTETIDTLTNNGNGVLSKIIEEEADNLFKEKYGYFQQMITDIKGHGKKEGRLYDLLRYNLKSTDQFREESERHIINLFTNKFVKLSDKDRQRLTMLLDGDISSIIDENIDLNVLIELLLDEDKLKQEIKTTSQIVNKASYGKNYINNANHLGYFMATGKLAHAHIAYNAHAIVSLFGDRRKVDKNERNKYIKPVDKLASLYYLQYIGQNNKEGLAKIIKRELDFQNKNNNIANPITAIINLQRDLKKEAKETIFNNNVSLMVKGYTKDILNPYVDVKIGKKSEEEEMYNQGYDRNSKPIKRDKADSNTEDMYLYINKHSGLSTNQTGAFSITETSSAGINTVELGGYNQKLKNSIYGNTNSRSLFLNKKGSSFDIEKLFNVDFSTYKTDDTTLMAPLYNEDGFIVAYRYLLNRHQKDSFLDNNNNFDERLARTVGNIIDKKNTKKINRFVVEALYDQYKQEPKNKLQTYRTISANSTDPEMVELWNLLPEDTRKYVHKVWGSPILFVRKDLIPLVFGGGRKWDVRKYFTPDLNQNELNIIQELFVEVAKLILGDRAGHRLHIAHEGVTIAVSSIKNWMLIRSFFIAFDNFVSNTLYLKALGLPLHNIVRDMKEAMIFLNQYTKDRDNLAQLELKLQLEQATNISKTKQEIAVLKHKIATNPIIDLINEGVFQVITEDVEKDRNAYSYKNKIKKKVDNALDWLPNFAKHGLKTVFVAEGTQLYNVLENLFRGGDFIARYALYKHYTEVENKPKLESIREVVDAFINYDLPVHKFNQAMNDYGLFWFYKYNIKVQKLIFNLFKNHSSESLLIYLFQRVLGDVSDIADSTFVLAKSIFSIIGLPTSALVSALENLITVKAFETVTP